MTTLHRSTPRPYINRLPPNGLRDRTSRWLMEIARRQGGESRVWHFVDVVRGR